MKINPIATWTDDDVAGYIADHDVPVNPLMDQGYLSIGCMPCTRPNPDDPRSGRWPPPPTGRGSRNRARAPRRRSFRGESTLRPPAGR